MQSEHEAGSLQGAFQGFGAAPSDALWGNIAGALDEKKKRRGFYWWWVGTASAAAIAILWVAISMMNSQQPAPETSIVAPTPVENNEEKEQPRKVQLSNLIEGIDSVISDDSDSNEDAIQNLSIDADERNSDWDNDGFKNIKSNKHSHQTNNAVTDFIDEHHKSNALDGPEVFSEITTTVDEANAGTIAIAQLEPSLTEQLIANVKMPDQRLCRFTLEEEAKRPWEYGFNVSYWLPVNMSFNKAEQSVVSTTTDVSNGNLIDQQYGVLELAAAPSVPVNGTARRNFNADAFVGKYFSKRWAWRIGLGFSRSTYRSNYPNTFLVSEANTALTSITLPLSLRLDMIQKPRYRMRAGFGVHTELPILETSYGDYNGLVFAQSSTYKTATIGYMGGLQLDVASEWRLKRNLNLTVTPSYRWYFTQSVPSFNGLVRKDHWLGIQAGLSWEF